MSEPLLDRIARQSRWRHRSVAEKATLSCGLIACAVVLPPWPASVLVFSVAVAALRRSGLSAQQVVALLRLPLMFILVAGLSTAVSVGGSESMLSTSSHAIGSAVATVLRAVGATTAMMLLAATTPMSDLSAFLRRLGVPAACVDVITVMYRMVFILLDSLAVVRKSQTARLGYSSVGRSIRSAGLMTASVLIRAWRRGEALERGMASRNLGVLCAPTAACPVSIRFVVGSVATAVLICLVSLATTVH